MDELKKILDYCESIIDIEKINKKIQKQKDCLQFAPLKSACVKIDYPSKKFTRYSMQETHDDFAKMMVNELIGALPISASTPPAFEEKSSRPILK